LARVTSYKGTFSQLTADSLKGDELKIILIKEEELGLEEVSN